MYCSSGTFLNEKLKGTKKKDGNARDNGNIDSFKKKTRHTPVQIYPIILSPFIPRGLIAVFRLQVD